MFRIFFDKANALFLAIAVHVAFVMILLVSLDWSSRPVSVQSAPPPLKVEPIQAVVVDEAKVQEELTKIKEQEQMARQAEEAHLRKIEQKAKAAERRRKEEERKLAAAKKKLKIEQERLRKKAKKEEAEKIAARKRKEKEEQQRKAKEEALKKEAARKKKEEERERKEAEQALAQKLAEEQAKREQRLLDQYRMEYIVDIKSAVEHNWIRPAGTEPGLKCKLKVTQIPSGEVVDVSVIVSSGNSTFDRSAVAAVFKSSPLPSPRDSSAFDRNIVLTFSPEK